MHMNLDPFLVDKIVDEVKSQGVFDQFRKDSMSDVDTKPAYQNLRQRVETTVSKFLAEQNWTPEMNKNQLREKLRKHITEAGFLDMGVERIVDQVVNPKISTVFQPKIEDIAYAFLGIEKPQVKEEPRNFTNGDLSIKTDFLLTDLEAVSPDSDKVTDEKPESKEDLLNDSDDKNEEFESPPFEPLEGLGRPASPEKKEDSNHSQLSGISGLTSQDSVEDMKVELSATSHAEVTQESELSAVSSNSRLSIVTNGDDSKSNVKEETDVGISEEAQMPKFSDTTSSNLNSGEPLHFDIKKEEIKFEGTDWKSEKRDYYSYMSEELPEETVKIELDDPNVSPLKQQVGGKADEPSGSSNLTYSTDTQEQETSKLADFEKEGKSASDTENNENRQSSITQELDKIHNDKSDKNHTETFKKGDRTTSSTSNNSKKKSVEKVKQGSSENGSSYHSEKRNDSHSPKNHSSSSRSHTSSSYHSSKSRSHKSKHSRDKDRDRSKDRKHRSDKEKNDKNDEYCSDRKKKYRRKSTDSNEDGDTSKDTSKNNSTASLDKIEGGKESNNSNSSSSYSTKTNGSTEGSSNIPTAEQISHKETAGKVEFIGNYPKPVVLDGFLGNSNDKGNIELIIGTRVSVSSKYREQNKYEEPLLYFNENCEEKLNFDTIIDKISKMLSQFKSVQTSYLVNCEDGFKSAFQKIGLKVLDSSEFDLIDHKDIDLQSENDKSKGNLTGKKKQQCLNLPNGKRKKDIEDYYQAAYHVFTDDKIHNNSHSLIIDCFNYKDEEHINKKLKTDSFAKVSPTPSELSLGSKENEFTIKNVTEKCKDDSTAAKRAAAFKANQRYSSEDLYKPRPVLGQRSRRRALETEVM